MCKELHIISGCMFSEKSTSLISASKKRSYSIKALLNLDKCNILYVTHSIDTRFGINEIRSRLGISVPAIMVSDLYQLEKEKEFEEAHIVCIDEIQFFQNIRSFIEKHDKIFYVSGLNGDSEQRLFGELYTLLPIADSFKLENAYCIKCGNVASFTYCTRDKSNTIFVGDSEYIAVCRSCLNTLKCKTKQYNN